jgi:hypothetical protein
MPLVQELPRLVATLVVALLERLAVELLALDSNCCRQALDHPNFLLVVASAHFVVVLERLALGLRCCPRLCPNQ